MALPSLIAFGALAPWPASARLTQLQHAVGQQQFLGPVIEAVHNLPLLWKSLSTEDPHLQRIAGAHAAEQLSSWITGAETIHVKSNATQMPLTIIAQINQYMHHIRQSDQPIDHASVINSVSLGGGIQGFCVGILSALAVASGETEEDVGKFAATAVRLAFCVGAYVDLDQSRDDGDSRVFSFALRWKAGTTLEHIEQILSKYPGTHIAVIRDIRDATITVPISVAKHVLEDLAQVGASFHDIGVSGRYHASLHKGVPQKIAKICQEQFQPAVNGHSLVRSNTDASLLTDENATLLALKCILEERADWYSTMSTATSALHRVVKSPFILSIGTDAVPQSIARKLPVVKSKMADGQVNGLASERSVTSLVTEVPAVRDYPPDAIAVIGMACKFPGADSVDEFWDLLTEGKSMLSEMPAARFGTNCPPRSSRGQRFLGNFLEDIEAFDHGFFKKSSREAQSMDPQQRLLLQIAYESLESSGYFADFSKPEDVGCYIGACATDYDFNVASHPPTAYSAIGTLRSFLSGKLSHYFGWSGPSLVLDTACSSSAVAIHTACTALRTSQCSMAVAGGITLMTSPYLYENFTAAHFLSQTGGSKPFSADADGYCRGEGGGLVVLKRLSDALRDSDHILGVIAASGVNQNNNCVPITVPHTSSQSNLYERVTKSAGVVPSELTFVEAHGTGTPVGDPIEMESIRRVFGGADRNEPLIVSSAKGNIGHLEGASGVAALIKTILQMEHRLAPRQASFKTLNPKIPALEPDNFCIPTSNLKLQAKRLTACVNNYGAAGSNAAMIILDPPRKGDIDHHDSKANVSSRPRKYPIQISASSETSLLAYCKSLADFCSRLHTTRDGLESSQILANLAFSLAARLNQELPFTLTTAVAEPDSLRYHLREQASQNNNIKQRSKALPVVLCFGGQVSDRVALARDLWQDSTLLSFHLDMCDDVLKDMGYSSIYPAIFQSEPVTDVVILHSMIFAMQYSSAKAWLDSGLKIAALIGHSFGQLTGLCVSGVLSLRDGLRLVAGRASLMQKCWGSETGTMIAVETDSKILTEIQGVLRTSSSGSYDFEIACFNGSTSHVVVSDKASADELETNFLERGIRHKKLDVPYGFHSRFTDPLLSHIEDLAATLTFQEPQIPLETCTRTSSWEKPTSKLIAGHTRDPVFFSQAVQRLQDRLGPCTWLEAGSDSSIVNMVRKALGQPSATAHHFVPMQLNKPNSNDLVVDATISLWNAGHRLQYWRFHRSQSRQYDRLRLPSYAWDKSKHWLELDMSAALGSSNKSNVPLPINRAGQVKLPPVLMRLESVDSSGHHFVIDPISEEFQAITRGVMSQGKSTCPTGLYLELARRAVGVADEANANELLSIQNLQVHSLELHLHGIVSLDLQRLQQGWKFRLASLDGPPHTTKSQETLCFAEGTVSLEAANDTLKEECSRYERLTAHDNKASIMGDPRSESLGGNVIYKMLSSTATYPQWYWGVKYIVAVDSRLIARVTRPSGVPTVVSKGHPTQLPILESFIQVVSLHANNWRDCTNGEVLRLAKTIHLQYAPGFESDGFRDNKSAENSWDMVAYTSPNAEEVAYDIFVYDVATTKLVLFMIGVQFTASRTVVALADLNAGSREIYQQVQSPAVPMLQPKVSRPKKDAKRSIYEDICRLLEELADIPKDQVPGDSSFDDLGVDSLMMIEVISELSTLFRMDLPIEELEELTDINSLVNYLHGKGCIGTSFAEDDHDSASQTSSQTPFSGISSPFESLGESAATTPPHVPSSVDSDVVMASKPKFSGPDSQPLDLGIQSIHDVFIDLRFDFKKSLQRTGANGFWKNVYPQQANLVCAYVVDTYRKLGCDLASLAPGQQLSSVTFLPRHKQLEAQLRNILMDSGIIELRSGQQHIRTAKALDSTSTGAKYEAMLQEHPLHACETKLLDVTGSHIADCMTGKKEPLALLFGNKHNRELLADFYANSPMCKAATRLLAEFVTSKFSATQPNGILLILEVGAGTGGTTKHLVELLTRCGVQFEYTFTDISSSLVSQAKKNLSHYPQMRFMTFDCDGPAPQELLQKFHIVISTNCIHATSNITQTTSNILPTLRDGGALCLVEFTRNIYWFDLVFGLLEGWWVFTDGRQHALADEMFWDSRLRAAGFSDVSWTDGDTEEAKTLRLICAFKGKTEGDYDLSPPNRAIIKRAGVPMEEVVFKRAGTLDLYADVYFPKTPDPPGKERPIALFIHGGGHFLFGRKDIPMKHIRTMIDRGFLPISVDYRLCPETTLFEGPMTDCCDALKWSRETLPKLQLLGPSVKVDPTRIVAIGVSSGGQLAMSLGYTAPSRGIEPPTAIFAEYPPSDMESDHWHKPCYPLAAEEEPTEVEDILAGVRESPILEYAPVSEKRTMALSLTLKDDRAKIILHMCWKSQTVQTLVHGLPHRNSVSATDTTDWKYPPPASDEQVQQISPLWQIRHGNYKTPTFIVHGNADDWLPVEMSERTIQELKSRGVPAELAIPDQCTHAFDLFPVGDPLGVGWASIEKGYDFICGQLGMK